MPTERSFSGSELEAWFVEFAQKENLVPDLKISLTKLVNKLQTDLYRRFTTARRYLENDFPEGNRWIDEILLAKQEPRLKPEEKQAFINRLLDVTVAIDAVIQMENGQSKKIVIAVDVTADPTEETSKILKVKGQGSSRRTGFRERNQNIPKLRKWLGIDKHLVLVLNNNESLLPSREKLLDVLQTFAESTTITGAVNLKSLKPTETLGYTSRNQERRKAFKVFLYGYLDQAVRSVISNLERLDGEISQSEDEQTRSYKVGNFSWNWHPDDSVSITRINDGSIITPETATQEEMRVIRDFVVTAHQTYLKNKDEPKNDLDPPDHHQRPKPPKL